MSNVSFNEPAAPPGIDAPLAPPPHPAPMTPGDEAPEGTPGTGQNVCRRCSGSGRVDNAMCPACEGTGYVVTGIGGA